jgi:hypothetical protein
MLLEIPLPPVLQCWLCKINSVQNGYKIKCTELRDRSAHITCFVYLFVHNSAQIAQNAQMSRCIRIHTCTLTYFLQSDIILMVHRMHQNARQRNMCTQMHYYRFIMPLHSCKLGLVKHLCEVCKASVCGWWCPARSVCVKNREITGSSSWSDLLME